MRTGNGQLTVTWSAPANNGSALEDYTVQWKESSFSPYFWEGLDVGRADLSASVTTYTITGLDNDTAYQVRVRATNAGRVGRLVRRHLRDARYGDGPAAPLWLRHL